MTASLSDRLRDTVAERGPGAYVLTVSADGRPHAVYLDVIWEDGRLVLDVGGSTARNATARPDISLLFPVRHAGDYSFFVDGRATVASSGDVNRMTVVPTRAVFHRHGPAPDPASSCSADCLPVLQLNAGLTREP